MTDLEQLLAIEAIKHLKARYFHCMDLKDWEGLRDVFSSDAIFDVRGALEPPQADAVYSDPPISGVDNIVDYIQQGLTPLVSVHYGHMPQIEILDEDRAQGLWALEDWLYSPAGTFHGQGHYHETYVKDQGRWCIQHLRLTRQHVQSDF
jgi:hypothetical protein